MLNDLRITMALLLLASNAGVLACASGATTPPAAADAGSDTEDSGQTDNNGAGDVGNDVTPDVDVRPDTPVEEEDDGCGECCPNDRVCLEPTVVGVCAADGRAFERMPCGGDQVCQEGTATCGPPPISCQPGVSSCIDLATQQTCNARGDGYTTRSCGEGQCVGGSCVTGAMTAEACEAETDCAGGECLCRGEEACTAPFQSTWGASGYCTSANCGSGGCVAGEVCVDFGVSGVLTGGQHCVEDCLRCSADGYACQAMPVRMGAGRTWQDACVPSGLKGFGQFCSAGAECRGGTCLRGEGWPANGYCAATCSEDAQCPSDSKCVQFPDDQYYCAVHCGDGRPNSGPCPEGLGVDVSCQLKSDLHGAGIVYVCMPR